MNLTGASDWPVPVIVAHSAVTGTAYKLECPAAVNRLLVSGIPATVEHGRPVTGEGQNSAMAVAETVQHFITAMDSLKLSMVAVDQVSPGPSAPWPSCHAVAVPLSWGRTSVTCTRFSCLLLELLAKEVDERTLFKAVLLCSRLMLHTTALGALKLSSSGGCPLKPESSFVWPQLDLHSTRFGG